MAICNTLRELRGHLTILAISPHPAMLEVADRAYRLQNGEAALLAEADLINSLDSGEDETFSDRKMQPIVKRTNLL